MTAIVTDVVDIAIRLQGIDHLVHRLLEAVGLVVIVTVLYAIDVAVKAVVVARSNGPTVVHIVPL